MSASPFAATSWEKLGYNADVSHCFVEFEKVSDCGRAWASCPSSESTKGKRKRTSDCVATRIGPAHLLLRYSEPKSKNTFHKFIRDHLRPHYACVGFYFALFGFGLRHVSRGFIHARLRVYVHVNASVNACRHPSRHLCVCMTTESYGLHALHACVQGVVACAFGFPCVVVCSLVRTTSVNAPACVSIGMCPRIRFWRCK